MKPFDFSFIDETNAVLGAIVVVADYIFGEHWLLFAVYMFLNILDYITGVAKSKVLKIESSLNGSIGILKKFGYWVILMLAFLMSPVFNELGEIIGADISKFTPVIGYMILAMLIMNEFRSVLENLYTCGVDVPPLLMTGLAVFEKVATNAQAKLFDGMLEIRNDSDTKYHVDIKASEQELKDKDTVVLKVQKVDSE